MLLRRHKNRHDTMTKAADINSAAKEPVALEDMTVEQLQEYAEQNGIDIGKATSQDGILKKIQEANEEAAE